MALDFMELYQLAKDSDVKKGTHGWKGSESNEVCSVQKVFDIWAGLSYKSLLSIDLNDISGKCVQDLRKRADSLNAEMGREVVMFRIKDDPSCWSGKVLEIGVRTVDFSVNCITDNFKLDYTSQLR
jgi:hypothetical protein